MPGPWEDRRVPRAGPRVTAAPCALRSWFEDHGLAGKLRAIQTVSCLLQGPCDAGNRALELSGVMESVIALCASEREEEQLVAVEALIHAAGKAKRASFITANGVSLLKDLYKRSEKDSICIRALVVRWAGPRAGHTGRWAGSPGWRLRVQPQLPLGDSRASAGLAGPEPWSERAPDEAGGMGRPVEAVGRGHTGQAGRKGCAQRLGRQAVPGAGGWSLQPCTRRGGEGRAGHLVSSAPKDLGLGGGTCLPRTC